jgi:Domain of unknown function (DUF4214)
MARLVASYSSAQEQISTELFPDGSTLLGSAEGLAARAAITFSVFSHASVTPQLVEITLTDGSKLFASGSFSSAFQTNSAQDFIDRVSGTITQIVEIVADDPLSPRYTLSDISISIKDYFSTLSWEDVLSGRDTLIGGFAADHLVDYGGGAVFEGRGGNDVLVAAEAIKSVAVYEGNLQDYLIYESNDIRYNDNSNLSGFKVQDLEVDRDGLDSLINIERLQFSDTNLALDIELWDNAGSAYRLYKAAFDREPDEVGLGYWIEQLDNGGSLQLAASGFLISDEFRSLYGSNPSDTLFLTRLYNNVLDRDPDEGGLNYWIGQINNGMSRESALINFSESNENVSNVAALIDNGIQYQPWLG